MKRLIVATFCFACIACGGSSGGGGTASYAGIWDYSASKFLDDCGTNVPQNAGVTLTVNQDGNRVVVDSGQIVLTGQTNDEDGFAVAHESFDGSCETATAYVFKNASDGIADVGLGLVVRCGARQCRVGYGGQALKRGRSGIISANESPDLEDILLTVVESAEKSPAARQAHARSAFEKDLYEQATELANELLNAENDL